jgi:hypothetical protein
MSDLINRLRAMPSSFNDACRTMDDAADRIEALEAALRDVLHWYGGDPDDSEEWSDCMLTARAALAPETKNE